MTPRYYKDKDGKDVLTRVTEKHTKRYGYTEEELVKFFYLIDTAKRLSRLTGDVKKAVNLDEEKKKIKHNLKELNKVEVTVREFVTYLNPQERLLLADILGV